MAALLPPAPVVGGAAWRGDGLPVALHRLRPSDKMKRDPLRPTAQGPHPMSSLDSWLSDLEKDLGQLDQHAAQLEAFFARLRGAEAVDPPLARACLEEALESAARVREAFDSLARANALQVPPWQ